MGQERVDSGLCASSEVNSPSATTLENNEKIPPGERAENELRGEVGGATEPAVEPSLGSKPLKNKICALRPP